MNALLNVRCGTVPAVRRVGALIITCANSVLKKLSDTHRCEWPALRLAAEVSIFAVAMAVAILPVASTFADLIGAMSTIALIV